jgi:hypothetical protein
MQQETTQAGASSRNLTGRRLTKAVAIGVGIVLLLLFANGEQAAFIYQNF